MATKLRRENNKLKLHRSHVTAKHFRMNSELADSLANQTKRLARRIKYSPGGKINRHSKLLFSRVDLSKGCTVFVPPALILDIPLVIEPDEAIAHVKVVVVKDGSDEIWLSLLRCSFPLSDQSIDIAIHDDDTGKYIVQIERQNEFAMDCRLIPGKYTLSLGNLFQYLFEKRLWVQIVWVREQE